MLVFAAGSIFVRRFVRALPAVGIVLAVVVGHAAEDTVVYATGKDSRGRATVRGTVLDYTGGQLLIRTDTGREQSVPTDRVVEVRTAWPAGQAAGDKLLAEGQPAAAAEQYQQAFREESRVWAQREILARCVRALTAAEQFGRAGEAFLRLVRSDRQTRHFAAVPLAWTPRAPDAAFQQQALGWLANRQESVAVLLGGSWLLNSGHRAAATAALQRLLTDADRRVAQLADAQLWRTRIAAATAEDLKRWEAAIGRMPPELRGGPYYVLAQGLAAAGNSEQAALAFLRIPILHPDDRRLAAAALLSAARELEKTGQRSEAAGLYQELVQRYAASAEAAEAAGRLEAARAAK